MAGSAFFSPRELECRCEYPDCDAVAMLPMFLAKLDLMRVNARRPLFLSSASRCARHNRDVGGAEDSQHVRGNAADIIIPASRWEAEGLARLAIKAGMGGIGIAEMFVHVDDGPPGRRWTYPPRAR